MLAGGVVVGRILKSAAAPVGMPWLWTLAYGHHEDRWPTHGYEPTREAAMAALAKSWPSPHVSFGTREPPPSLSKKWHPATN